MKFNYIVMRCIETNGKVVELPIIFPSSMSGFEIQEALENSSEVFEIYKSNKLVSYGIVYITKDGVTCEGHSENVLNNFRNRDGIMLVDGRGRGLNVEEVITILKARKEIDEQLITSFN